MSESRFSQNKYKSYLCAMPNLIGRYLLKQINSQQFRQVVLVTMTISGALIL